MATNDIPFMSASELAESIRRRQISPVEAVDAYLDRIDSVGDKLNAYITICAEQARAEAKELESEAIAGNLRGRCTGCRWVSRTRSTRRAYEPPTHRKYAPILCPSRMPPWSRD